MAEWKGLRVARQSLHGMRPTAPAGLRCRLAPVEPGARCGAASTRMPRRAARVRRERLPARGRAARMLGVLRRPRPGARDRSEERRVGKEWRWWWGAE